MGKELDLLAKYPKGKRDPSARAREKTEEDVRIARQFGKEFFDGDRRHGYGGYSPDAQRWHGVAMDMMRQYGSVSSVCDVGCGKGGLTRAFKDKWPWMYTAGCDVSEYAIECAQDAHPGIRFDVADCRKLPYAADVFSLAVSINTIHNLDRDGVIKALQEIQRIGRRCYVTVDTYRNDEEKQRMFDWNLTAQTILHVDEWKALFKEAGYEGDYGWWVP